MGAVLKAVPQVLILVLTLSLIEAFLILPNHLSHSLHKAKQARKTAKFKTKFLASFEQFRNTRLVSSVETVVEYRYAFLGAIVTLLLVSIATIAGGILKFQPFLT